MTLNPPNPRIYALFATLIPNTERKDELLGEKARHTVWLSPGAWDQVERLYRKDNCSTKNEYIEKAIRFYSGYLEAGRDASYLPRVLAGVLEGKLAAFGSRIGSLLFKLAVNDGMLTTLAADTIDIDQPTLDRLRSQCVRDTRQIHGVIDLQDAVQARED